MKDPSPLVALINLDSTPQQDQCKKERAGRINVVKPYVVDTHSSEQKKAKKEHLLPQQPCRGHSSLVLMGFGFNFSSGSSLVLVCHISDEFSFFHKILRALHIYITKHRLSHVCYILKRLQFIKGPLEAGYH